jgi:hypothetical protein
MITDIVVQPAGNKGFGVFAGRDFAPGEFIFRRRHGRVVRNEEIGSLSPRGLEVVQRYFRPDKSELLIRQYYVKSSSL